MLNSLWPRDLYRFHNVFICSCSRSWLVLATSNRWHWLCLDVRIFFILTMKMMRGSKSEEQSPLDKTQCPQCDKFPCDCKDNEKEKDIEEHSSDGASDSGFEMKAVRQTGEGRSDLVGTGGPQFNLFSNLMLDQMMLASYQQQMSVFMPPALRALKMFQEGGFALPTPP
ncbi:uncharacterized protein LOC111243133 [Varroa destructor]|uniref:Uncharacterized protein n=1 Tax=Varroa destructor TaxID=109461 RepID=A0A7M7IZS2_VARDE|nr:uncharacterized protein LOC111243133 [Varroa destructor]